MKNKVVYNSISKQNKTGVDKITPEEWNNIINSLVIQANKNAEILKQIEVLNISLLKAVDFLTEEKVPETRTIANINLKNNISKKELTEALQIATEDLSGIISKEDYLKLKDLHETVTSYIEDLEKMIEAFQNFPKETKVIDLISNKVDKVNGYEHIIGKDFWEGYGNFDIDKDCKRNVIYLNVSLYHLGIYSDSNMLIELQEFSGNEDVFQILIDFKTFNKYKRIQTDEYKWTEWEEI